MDVLFGVFPVLIVQSNHFRTALTAKIRGLPEWIETEWSGNLTSERTERRDLDNRTLIATNVLGDAAFDITAALTNETVGGRCILQSRVGESATGTHALFIRGKNPLDATARAYITSHVDEEFRPYAWKIAKHETLVGVAGGAMCYNQFNPREGLKELPNRGAPDGWGIGQIDRSRNQRGLRHTTTKEVYDWHENVVAMNGVLRKKRDRYLEIVRLFRNRYQNDPTTHWAEPNVTTSVNDIVLSAREWSIMTLYNGAGGCPPLPFAGHTDEGSPIHFDPSTSSWSLHTNLNDYVPRVMSEADRTEVD